MADGKCRMADGRCCDGKGRPRFLGVRKWVAPSALPGDGAWPDLRHKNKVHGRGRRPKDGGRKRGAEGVGSAASLLMGTRARDGGDRQNPGKPHENPRK